MQPLNSSGLDNQGQKGFFSNDFSGLHNLQVCQLHYMDYLIVVLYEFPFTRYFASWYLHTKAIYIFVMVLCTFLYMC